MKNIAIMERLSQLPRKMARIRGHEILPDCLLYELISELCFDCSYAAYFVYNPDFHLCKGVAGISKEELGEWENDPWHDMEEFESKVRSTSFNRRVRNLHASISPTMSQDQIVETIKNAMQNIFDHAYVWDVHNGNHGVFLYTQKTECKDAQARIADGASLLSFCFF